ARSDRRAAVRRPRRLRQEGRAHRLALRHRAHARERVLGLPARPELHLPARDVRRGAVGVETEGGARRGDSDVPPRGHPRDRRGRRDERLLAHHGRQLPEDGVGGRVALRDYITRESPTFFGPLFGPRCFRSPRSRIAFTISDGMAWALTVPSSMIRAQTRVARPSLTAAPVRASLAWQF